LWLSILASSCASTITRRARSVNRSNIVRRLAPEQNLAPVPAGRNLPASQ
jgi:hypothetical protein